MEVEVRGTGWGRVLQEWMKWSGMENGSPQHSVSGRHFSVPVAALFTSHLSCKANTGVSEHRFAGAQGSRACKSRRLQQTNFATKPSLPFLLLHPGCAPVPIYSTTALKPAHSISVAQDKHLAAKQWSQLGFLLFSNRLEPAGSIPQASPITRAACSSPETRVHPAPQCGGADVLQVYPAACSCDPGSWSAGHSPGLPSQRLAGTLHALLTLVGGQG